MKTELSQYVIYKIFYTNTLNKAAKVVFIQMVKISLDCKYSNKIKKLNFHFLTVNLVNYHTMAKSSEVGCPNLSRYFSDACLVASFWSTPFSWRAFDGSILYQSVSIILQSIYLEKHGYYLNQNCRSWFKKFTFFAKFRKWAS